MDSGVAVMGADLPEVQKILRIAQSEESCFELGAGAGRSHRFRPGVPKFASANRRARLAPLINRFDDALLRHEFFDFGGGVGQALGEDFVSIGGDQDDVLDERGEILFL